MPKKEKRMAMAAQPLPLTLKVIAWMAMIAGYLLTWVAVGAPRDPMGTICDNATPLSSLVLFITGARETGCATRDAEIATARLWERGDGER